MYKCKYCTRKSDNVKVIASHLQWCKKSPKKRKDVPFKYINVKGRKGTNPGLSPKDWMTEEGYKNFIKNLKKNCKGRALTKEKEKERKLKLSKIAKLNKYGNYGGYKRGAGRGKKGWYKGIWCDSSWELAWIIYAKDFNIKFKRNNKRFDYYFKNKLRKWIPDYTLSNGIFLEIKGWMTPQTKAKIDQFQEKLIVLMWPEFKNIYNYVVSKYGKDFIKMYEKTP